MCAFNPFFKPLSHALINYAPPGAAPDFLSSLNFYSGTITDGQTQDVAITEVDLSRALIIFCDCRFNTNDSKLPCIAYFQSSSTVRLERGTIATGIDTVCNFFVVEISSFFLGSVNEYFGNFGGGSNNLDIPISEVDLSKSIILKKGFFTTSIITNFNYWFYTLEFLNSTTVRCSRSSVGAVVAASFTVLEIK